MKRKSEQDSKEVLLVFCSRLTKWWPDSPRHPTADSLMCLEFRRCRNGMGQLLFVHSMAKLHYHRLNALIPVGQPKIADFLRQSLGTIVMF